MVLEGVCVGGWAEYIFSQYEKPGCEDGTVSKRRSWNFGGVQSSLQERQLTTVHPTVG